MRGYRVLLSMLLVISLLLLPSCGWLSPRTPPSEPRMPTTVVSGKVEVPSGSPLSLSDLEVSSIADSAMVDREGSFSVRMAKELPQVVFVKDTITQNMVLLGYQVPGNRVVIGAESTALALVMTHPLFMYTNAEQRRKIAQRAMALSGFSQLVSDIENLLINDPHNLFAHPEIYEQAESIAIEALDAIIAQGTGRSAKATPLGIGWITPAPLVKQISEDGKRVVFENIGLLYYGAGYYDRRAESALLAVEIIDRTDVYQFQREWPFITVAQPKPTTHERPMKSSHVIFNKGIFSGRPLDAILNDPPARAAFSANVIDMILEIIDLFVPIKLFLPSPPILAYMIDFESPLNHPTLRELAGDYVSATRAISLLRTLITNNSDKIVTALAKYIEQAKEEKLGRWLKDLASWIKWPIKAFEILTEKLPYFLDLSRAEVQGSYHFFGKLQINSTPSGAKVFLDGEEKAFTTDHLFTLYAGEVTIKLTKVGYEDWHGTVVVIPDQTATINVTLIPKKGRPPTAPTNLRATAISPTRIDLSWNAPTDNVGVLEYKIYRNGTHIASTFRTSYRDMAGLTPSTLYCYQVSACDEAGNESVLSNEACAITLAEPTAIAPSAVYGTYFDPLTQSTALVPTDMKLELAPNGTFTITLKMHGIQVTMSTGRYKIVGDKIILTAPQEIPFASFSIEGKIIENAVVFAAPVGAVGFGVWVKQGARTPSRHEVVGKYFKEGSPVEQLELRKDGTFILKAKRFGTLTTETGTWKLDGHVLQFSTGRLGVALGKYVCFAGYPEDIPSIWIKAHTLSPVPKPETIPSLPASPEGLIIFARGTRTASGFYSPDIYVVSPDGTAIRNLTNHPAWDGAPAWAPDGTRITFYSEREDGVRRIYVMHLADRSVGAISGDHAESSDWSPDGTKIVFTQANKRVFGSGTLFESDIWVTNADGTNPYRLTSGPDSDLFPDWSPDGTRIVFQRRIFDGRIYKSPDIFVMNADGSNLRNLTDHPAYDGHPAWSPDGTKIAFSTDRDGNWEIYVMDASGKNLRNLTNHPASDDSPAWSPDGTKIVFVSDRDGFPALWVMNSDGSNPRKITGDPAFCDYGPDWGPPLPGASRN